MFADKLQNPFLKPSPFAASSASYTPSYTPSYTTANRTPPKYTSYSPYQDSRPSLPVTNNQYSQYEHHYNPHSSNAFETKDIDSILSKNPFNRQYRPTFGVSRAMRDLSPSRAASNTYDIPNSYDGYDNYGVTPRNYESNRTSALQGARYSDSNLRVTPTKKYDNYLSTSSADSATTYINKIYDLEQDKVSVKETSKPLVNPFFRKNLLKTNNDPEPIRSDYDSKALKYMGYQMEDQRYRESSYQSNNYQSSYHPTKVETSLNRGLSFGNGAANSDPYTKYLENFENKYQSKSNLDRQIHVEDIYGTSGFGQQPRGNIGSSKNIQPNTSSYPGSKYNQYGLDNYEPQFGNNLNNNYDYESTFNKKPESNKYIDNKYDKYNKDDYKTSFKIEDQPYTYNLDGQYERPIKQESKLGKNMGYGGKEEDRVRFDQDRVGFQEESEEDITKYQGYGYEGKFETLGGNPQSAKPQQNEYKQKPYDQGTSFGIKQPYKFTSSQVDQYKNPQDMEKKIKQNKYRKLGIENEYERQQKSNKPIPIDQHYEQYGRPQLTKGPSRDSAEHPRVLEINGILFHRIEVM